MPTAGDRLGGGGTVWAADSVRSGVLGSVGRVLALLSCTSLPLQQARLTELTRTSALIGAQRPLSGA